ncbi:hypothetical protein [Micromonospora cathayae]|uniref:Uncharacterized protein n=1 Tax=Micromonospora cathayae TaxID=3028804 RepID=A0ABY7ZZP2_9ACTN|nr:hypothetical protein [Micromonospora sp. HUAS 3]WDZ87219.1 hypothetical protein PVK37_12825 [Micromonospora sp. HUAS 3]
MTGIDTPTQQQHAVPAPAADPTRPRWYVGRRRAIRGRHAAGAVRPVDVGHGLSPAARQLVAPTPEDQAVHAGVDQATGLLRIDDIQDARHKAACTHCRLAHHIDDSTTSPATEQARAAGWRTGTNGRGDQVSYCPRCAGADEDYWDDIAQGGVDITREVTP